MGYWGVKSYENDLADEALDAAFEQVHGEIYDELMDDRNPLTFEQVQAKLATPNTLTAAIAALRETLEPPDLPIDAWDEETRLALAGIVVRHAELGVPVPDDWRSLTIDWLENEEIDWDEETLRGLRRKKEIALLKKSSS